MKKAFGIILAIIAELMSVGLLATSGWFILSSAIAGLSVVSTFSYIIPSSFVRFFAVGRIGFNYWQKLVTHKASMNDLTAVREKFFVTASKKADGGQVPTGVLLDRLLIDTDNVSLQLIRVWVPIFVFIGVNVALLTLLKIIQPTIFMQFLIGIVLIGLYFFMAYILFSGVNNNSQQIRSQVRNSITGVNDSWLDLVTLGADRLSLNVVRNNLYQYEQSTLKKSNLESFIRLIGLLIYSGLISIVVAVLLSKSIKAERFVLIVLAILSIEGLVHNLVHVVFEKVSVDESKERLNLNDAVESKYPKADVNVTEQTLSIMNYLVPETGVAKGQSINVKLKKGLTIISGPSGTGKTTFLKNINNQIDPNIVRMVTTDDYIFSGTVRENLSMGRKVSDKQMKEVLTSLDLKLKLNQLIGDQHRELSGGEQNRLSIARALLSNKLILLLDEPLAGLDDTTAKKVMKLLDNQSRFTLAVIHEKYQKNNYQTIKFTGR